MKKHREFYRCDDKDLVKNKTYLLKVTAGSVPVLCSFVEKNIFIDANGKVYRCTPQSLYAEV